MWQVFMTPVFLLQKFIYPCASVFLLLENVFIIFKRESPMN